MRVRLLVASLAVVSCGGSEPPPAEAFPCEGVVCRGGSTCVDGACVCRPGYRPDGDGCADVDECAAGTHACEAGTSCRNTEGSHECSSDEVNECELDTTRPLCDPNATCVDLPDGYACVCNEGWSGDGETCEDVDECAMDWSSPICGDELLCCNTPGGFECVLCGDAPCC